MSVRFDIISLGTLSSNPFWGEPAGVRTPHATTTLIRDGERRILVDPSLPATALVQRLFERSGLRPEQVTDVFCTTLRPTHRRGLPAFGAARWLCPEGELALYREHLARLAESAARTGGGVAEDIALDRKLLERFVPAAEKVTEAVHLYPLPGPSPASAGLLLAAPTQTVLVAGDAALTAEHVLAGRAWSGSADVELALESLTELIQIADIIVCGHDNYMLSPARWMS